MAALVIAEHDKAHLRGGTANAITAATKMGGEVHVLVAGSGAKAAADDAAKLAGVTRVLHVDSPIYDGGIAENYAALVVPLAKGYSHLVASATAFGKNIMPRVAALLDVAQVSEISGVESADTFVRPIYAGNAFATVQSSDAIKVVTVRATGFDAAAAGGSAPVESLVAGPDKGQSKVLSQELTKSARPELAGARRADLQNSGGGRHGVARSIAWMFEVLKVRLIGLTAALDNVRSAKAIDGAGFKRMGEVESVKPDGTTRRSLYWELTRDEWVRRHRL